MVSPIKTATVALIGLTAFGASPALALKVAPTQTGPTNIRMAVSHDGRPLRVRIIALNSEGKQVTEGVSAFPSQLLATNTGRSVRVRFTPDVSIVCATTEPGVVLNKNDKFASDGGTNIHFRACVRTDGLSSSKGGSKGSLSDRLGAALSNQPRTLHHD